MQPQTQTPEPQTQPEQNQPEQQNQLQPVDDFLNRLLDEKGITNLDPEIRAGLIDQLRDTLLRQIDKEAILRLSEEQAAELDKKLDDPNFTPEQMAQFIQDSGVDLTAVTVDTMIKFRSFYLGAQE